MKATYLKFTMLLYLLLASVVCSAQDDGLGILFNIGFEDGTLPSGWKIEKVRGDKEWSVGRDNSFKGTYHLALYNGGTLQTDYRTMLVSETMDLSSLYNPILVFAHRQPQRTGDVDTLQVMYRTSADGEWIPVRKKFGSVTDNWKLDTIYLEATAGKREYQIAFHGSDNLGGGIFLDNIEVRSEPNCVRPDNIFHSDFTNTSCVLNWMAGFDATAIEVKITTRPFSAEELADDAQADGVFLDTELDGTEISLAIENLAPGKTYYAYVRATCTNEKSDWSDEYVFTMSSLQKLPYTEKFNMPRPTPANSQMPYWYWGRSMANTVPYVNTTATDAQLCTSSRDCSTSLYFQIDPGKWAYAATPRLDVADMKKVYITFEASSTQIIQYGFYRKIIVGVMTDPENYATFFPVDTISCENYRDVYDVTVFFDKYEGEGRHIAFMSDFDKNNQISIDNLTIDTIGQSRQPAAVKVKVPSSTTLELEWDSHGASKADILVATKRITPDADAQEGGDIIKIVTGIPAGKPYTIENLDEWTEYYLCVRNDNGQGKSAWSTLACARTAKKISGDTYSVDFDYDPKDPTTYYNPESYQTTNLYLLPGICALGDFSAGRGTTTPAIFNLSGKNKLRLIVGKNYKWSCAVFPEIENIREWQATIGHVANNARFAVGIMSDASDINSFYPLDTIDMAAQTFEHYTIPFGLYPKDRNGSFFAILATNDIQKNTNTDYNYVYIESLTFEKMPPCAAPMDVRVTTTPETATLNWTKLADAYNVRVSAKELTSAQLASGADNLFVFKADNIASLPLEITGLKAEQTAYYYYIQSVCEGETGAWSTGASFLTECYDKAPLPYYVDFDGTRTTGMKETAFPMPCLFTTMMQQNTSSYWHPYLETGKGLYYNGNASLALKSNKTDDTNPYPNYPEHTYVALPEMIENVADLQVTFMMKPATATETIRVGVMSDPYDISTFETVKEVTSKYPDRFYEFVVTFDSYKGKGRHIAFYNPRQAVSSSVYIDSVVVERNTCLKASDLAAKSITESGATLSWTDANPGQWDLVVSSQPLSKTQLEQAAAGTDGVVFADRITSKPYELTTGLEGNTAYYFYVRGVCGTDKAQWPYEAGMFRTRCMPVATGETTIETFDQYGVGENVTPACWTTGNQSVAVPAKDNYKYIPHCSDGYFHSGNASLYFHSTKQYSGAYAISSQINVGDIRSIEVSFWASATEALYKADTESELIVGVVSSPERLETFVPLDTIRTYPEEQFYRVRLDKYMTDETEDGKFVMFKSETDGNNELFIDDVRFDVASDCTAPVGLAAKEVNSTTVNISWRLGTAPYTVVYSDGLLTAEELEAGKGNLVGDNIADDNVEIKNLELRTACYAYAKSNCGENSVWSAPVRFEITCAEAFGLPFTDDFDHNPFTGMHRHPDCWSTYYAKGPTATDYPYVYLENKGDNALYVYVDYSKKMSYAVTPKLDVDDMTQCYVSFDGYAEYVGVERNIIVGLVEEVQNGNAIVSSFTPVDTVIFKSTDVERRTVLLTAPDGYTGNPKYVGFTTAYELNTVSSGAKGVAGGVRIDNVEIDKTATCAKPESVRITNVTNNAIAGEITGNAAQSWEVVCVETGGDPNTATPITLTAKNFNITGLTPQTSYDIYARNVCSAADKSKWFGPTTVNTVGNAYSQFPYTTGFEPADDNAEWNFANGTKANGWYTGTANGKDGSGSLYISHDGGKTARYNHNVSSYVCAYRTFDFAPGEYTVEFDWLCYGETNSDYLRVGLLPASVQFVENLPVVIASDGSRQVIGNTAAQTPAGWIALEGMDAAFNTVYQLGMADDWKHNKVNLMFSEETKGLYNLVVFWQNNSTNAEKPVPSAVIDNISIKQSSCTQPVNVAIKSMSAETVVLEWDKTNEEATAWEVYVTNNDKLFSPDYATPADKVKQFEVEDNTCELSGLDEWSANYVFIRSICGENYSDWSEKLFFRAECKEKSAGDVFGFEADNVYTVADYYRTVRTQPECFVVGHTKNIDPTKYQAESCYPYVVNGAENQMFGYARSGKNSLKLAASNKNQAGGYVALPAYDTENFGGLQLSFWIRPLHHVINTRKFMGTQGVGMNYSKTVTVGSMSDPYDFTTFKKIADVAYPYTATDITANTTLDDDPNGNEWWVKQSVVLPEDCQKHIVLYCADDYNQPVSIMYIDDITVEKIPDCDVPVNVLVTDVTGNSAKVSYLAANPCVVHVAKTPEMRDTVSADTVKNGYSHVLDKLEPDTRYYVHVKQICSPADISGWSEIIAFQTASELPFYEQFDSEVLVPENWKRANGFSYSSIFNGISSFVFANEQDRTGWLYSPVSISATGHQILDLSGRSYNDSWLFTPVIDLTTDNDIKLSFDLALTAHDSWAKPALTEDEGVVFMVVVSDDGGNSWKYQNATIWSNTKEGHYKFDEIGNEYEKVVIDLGNRYRGKMVQIAFYADANIDADLHLDNVRVNATSKTMTDLNDEICEYTDYNKYGFERRYSELQLGENRLTRYGQSADPTKPDTLFNLTLSVNSLARTYLKDSICEGRTYTENGFNATTAGVHKQKFSFADGRCDSIVYLDLKLIPTPKSVETITICQGQKHFWNGKYYDRSDVYTDTVPATSCDCDSIITLVLTVTEARIIPQTEIVCFGKSFEFGGETYRESTVVRDTTTNADGCISITELNLTVLPDYRHSYTAYFCKGTEYSDENFKGITDAGEYTNPLTSKVGGCDSTIVLNLVELGGGDTVRTEVQITVDELPYTIEGTDITYDADTKPGTYVDTVLIEAGDCSDILIHTLIVELPSGVDEVGFQTLVLAPNPVEAGREVRLDFDITHSERQNIVVEVYNAAGALISRTVPKFEPVTFTSPDVAGVYMVHVTDGNGNVRRGKLIVR